MLKVTKSNLEISFDKVSCLRWFDGSILVVVQLLVERLDGEQSLPVLYILEQGLVLGLELCVPCNTTHQPLTSAFQRAFTVK